MGRKYTKRLYKRRKNTLKSRVSKRKKNTLNRRKNTVRRLKKKYLHKKRLIKGGGCENHNKWGNFFGIITQILNNTKSTNKQVKSRASGLIRQLYTNIVGPVPIGLDAENMWSKIDENLGNYTDNQCSKSLNDFIRFANMYGYN